MNRCYACQACSVACKDWNSLEPGSEKWMSVYEWETGTFPDVRINALAFSCGHCEDPSCMKACAEGAIYKEEKYGAVLVDESKCVGCRECYDACPYGSPRFHETDAGVKMTKCTMCIDRLEEGKQPICAVSCPLRAFDFGSLDDLVEKYGDTRSCPGMPSPEITKPAYLIWGKREKEPVIPYDPNRAIELNSARGDLGTMFEDADSLTSFDEGTIARNELRMKFDTEEEYLRATRNDMA